MSVLKNISYLFSTQIINIFSGIITSIFLSRLLGAEGRGFNAIFTNSLAFAVLFFGFSISSTIPYFINSGKAKAEELLTTILIFVVGSSFLVYASLNVLESFGRLSWALPETVQSWQYKLIFTGMYFLNLLTTVLNTYLNTYKKFKAVSLLSIVFQIIPTLIYVSLYFDGRSAYGVDFFRWLLIILFLLSLTSTVSLIVVFIKVLAIKPSKKIIPFSLVRQFVLFSLMAYVGNVFQFFSYKLDFWLVDSYAGKAELGIYSLAAQLSQMLWLLPTAVASVLYTYASSSTEDEAVNYTIYLKKGALYATILLAIAGAVLSYYFVPVLYGSEFTEVPGLIAIFLIGVVPFVIPTIVAGLLAARGNFKISFYTSVFVSVMTIALYIMLIPRYGMIGGAVASAISYICSAVICEYFLYKLYKVSLFKSLLPDREFIVQVKKALNII